MSASITDAGRGIEPFFLRVPDAAWQRLIHRLGRERQSGEPWDAAIQYGAPVPALSALLDYWCDELEPDRLEQELNRLGLWQTGPRGSELCFVHRPSQSARARPLLLLHGLSGSPLEFAALLEELSESFHVVCPALPGCGLSVADYEPTLANVAATCARLMSALGYERYAVHGSDVGASVAAELARAEPGRVSALHVTHIAALPEAAQHELAALNSEEKSQLAGLNEREQVLRHAFPRTGCELLAFALRELAEATDEEQHRYREPLLLGLSLCLMAGDAEFRRGLARAALWPHLPRSETPACVCAFPLASPSLRRFAERSQRVVSWQEHDHGGGMPALEQPHALTRSLRSFCLDFQ